MSEPFDWADLVESAKARIAAAPLDKNAALDVLRQSAVALRDLLNHNLRPDPERSEYLGALLAALELIVNGKDPTTALHLSQGHRVRDQRLLSRNIAVFIDIGLEVDRLRGLGHTRSDKPVLAAQRSVAKQRSLSFELVKKAWHLNGGEDGWKELRPILKGELDEN